MTKREMEREIREINEMKMGITSMIDEQIQILTERSELVFKNEEADNTDYCSREERLRDLEQEIQCQARRASIRVRDELIYKVGGVTNA